MARPTSIRDKDILRAARSVFLERGIRATSAEVAKRAGVSEGSVFKRFPSKEDLFQAAMRTDLEALEHMPVAVQGLSGQGEVRANLAGLGSALLGMLRHILPLMMMRWSNPPSALERLGGTTCPPARVLLALTSYFESEMQAGRVARRNPEVLARTFLGALQNYVFFEAFVGLPSPLSPDEFVGELVDNLWRGCAPEAHAAAPSHQVTLPYDALPAGKELP
jgi:AcrR family transcriptional regulator